MGSIYDLSGVYWFCLAADMWSVPPVLTLAVHRESLCALHRLNNHDCDGGRFLGNQKFKDYACVGGSWDVDVALSLACSFSFGRRVDPLLSLTGYGVAQDDVGTIRAGMSHVTGNYYSSFSLLPA